LPNVNIYFGSGLGWTGIKGMPLIMRNIRFAQV
jgi:hypothetical protein